MNLTCPSTAVGYDIKIVKGRFLEGETIITSCEYSRKNYITFLNYQK